MISHEIARPQTLCNKYLTVCFSPKELSSTPCIAAGIFHKTYHVTKSLFTSQYRHSRQIIGIYIAPFNVAILCTQRRPIYQNFTYSSCQHYKTVHIGMMLHIPMMMHLPNIHEVTCSDYVTCPQIPKPWHIIMTLHVPRRQIFPKRYTFSKIHMFMFHWVTCW